jgi:SAM-dependent methyltransferase
MGLKQELARSGQNDPGVLLGFSLSPAMRRHFAKEGLPRCFRTDAAVGDRRFAPDFVCDLRRAAVRSRSIDWVFCSHVLEHIPDLEPCLSELARLLRPGGVGWIQVPLEPGLRVSRRIEINPERAHAHAWQFGEDFSSLIARDQWQVTESVADRTFGAEVLDRFGINPQERFWLLRRL